MLLPTAPVRVLFTCQFFSKCNEPVTDRPGLLYGFMPYSAGVPVPIVFDEATGLLVTPMHNIVLSQLKLATHDRPLPGAAPVEDKPPDEQDVGGLSQSLQRVSRVLAGYTAAADAQNVPMETLVLLLTDLHHYCDEHALTLSAAQSTAYRRYLLEKRDWVVANAPAPQVAAPQAPTSQELVAAAGIVDAAEAMNWHEPVLGRFFLDGSLSRGFAVLQTSSLDRRPDDLEVSVPRKAGGVRPVLLRRI